MEENSFNQEDIDKLLVGDTQLATDYSNQEINTEIPVINIDPEDEVNTSEQEVETLEDQIGRLEAKSGVELGKPIPKDDSETLAAAFKEKGLDTTEAVQEALLEKFGTPEEIDNPEE